MSTCLYADTGRSQGYPEYISLNERDGVVTLTIRGPAKDPNAERPFADAGDTVVITLDYARQLGLGRALALLVPE